MRTRLERFLKLHQISPQKLTNVSGIARQHLARIRNGEGLRLTVLRRIVQGVRYLLQQDVKASQLFDLGDEGDFRQPPESSPPKGNDGYYNDAKP